MVKRKDVTSNLRGRISALPPATAVATTLPVAAASSAPSSAALSSPSVPSTAPVPVSRPVDLFVQAPRQMLALELIYCDEGLQSRAKKVDVGVVRDYAEKMERGVQFPAVIVYYDGQVYWLADGFHRYEAHRTIDRLEIATEIRPGTRLDALLFSVGPANDAHGLRRSAADKRRSVELIIAIPEWANKSDRWVADHCSVSDKTVASVRRQQTAGQSTSSPVKREGRDGKTRQQPTPAPRPPMAARDIPMVAPPSPVVVDDRDTTYRQTPGGRLSDIGLLDKTPPAPAAPRTTAPQVVSPAAVQLTAAVQTTAESLDYLASSLPASAVAVADYNDLKRWIHDGRILLAAHGG